MVNLNQQNNFRDNDWHVWIAIIAMFWSPHLGLDYVILDADQKFHKIPGGQYIFFVVTVFAGAYLLWRGDIYQYFKPLKYKTVVVSLILFLIGMLISRNGLSEWRLLLIILIISGMSCAAANICTNMSATSQKWLIGCITLPYAVPVIGAIFLNFYGPIDVGIMLENTKHDTNPPRWHFMNMSANGFGFDAAIASFCLYLLGRRAKTTLLKLLFLALALVSLYALMCSGTRAAMLFMLSAVIVYETMLGGKLFLYGLLALSSLALITVVLFFDIGVFTEFLRLEGDLTQMTSKRWKGVVELWALFLQSPIVGYGFGLADNGIDASPSNIFYMAILVEVGLIGTLGILILFSFPVIKLALAKIFNKCVDFTDQQQTVTIWSFCIICSFLIYLPFEFNVLRVSVNNQMFFFCLFYVLQKCLYVDEFRKG